jgi:hypothetical protein
LGAHTAHRYSLPLLRFGPATAADRSAQQTSLHTKESISFWLALGYALVPGAIRLPEDAPVPVPVARCAKLAEIAFPLLYTCPVQCRVRLDCCTGRPHRDAPPPRHLRECARLVGTATLLAHTYPARSTGEPAQGIVLLLIAFSSSFCETEFKKIHRLP